jgi:hypothetical protein
MKSCLAFEDDTGNMRAMDADSIRNIVRVAASHQAAASEQSEAPKQPPVCIEFVFICACHSQSAGMAFVAAGVPHVIAIQTDDVVCDVASQVFMRHFYRSLLGGRKTVRESFEIARMAVQTSASMSQLASAKEPNKFLLLPHGANHDVQLFTDVPAGMWRNVSKPAAPHTLPAPTENFLGRNFLLQSVIESVAKRRLTTLTGVRGVGKSSLAVAAARYMWIRNKFDGVFMVDLRQALLQDLSERQQKEAYERATGGGAAAAAAADGGGAHAPGGPSASNSVHGLHTRHHSNPSSPPPVTLTSLLASACQLEDYAHDTNRLFKELRDRFERLLLVFDGVDILHPPTREQIEAARAHARENGYGNYGGGTGGEDTSPRKHRGRHSRGGEGQTGEGQEGVPSNATAAAAAPAVIQPPIHLQHDLRFFLSSLLKAVPNVKLLVTSTSGLGNVADVMENQLATPPLSWRDSAQLFWDLRPRPIPFAEFGCNDANSLRAMARHAALQATGGIPRRIFGAAPLLVRPLRGRATCKRVFGFISPFHGVLLLSVLSIFSQRECNMSELPARVEREIALEQSGYARELLMCQPHLARQISGDKGNGNGNGSRTSTPEPPSPLSHTHRPSNAHPTSPSPATPHNSPVDPAQQMFDHNSFLFFGGVGQSESVRRLQSGKGQPALTPEEERQWTLHSQQGIEFWRRNFGNNACVPWSFEVEQAFNTFIGSFIGSYVRTFEPMEFQMLRSKVEAFGSPQGYVHVQALGAFWHEFLLMLGTIRRILPLWIQSSPCRIIYGWCARPVCSALIIDGYDAQGSVVYKPLGTFAVRLSESKVGHLAIGFVDDGSSAPAGAGAPSGVIGEIHTLVTVVPASGEFILRIKGGDRSYPDFQTLLMQCVPFQRFHSGVDKMYALTGRRAEGDSSAAGAGADFSSPVSTSQQARLMVQNLPPMQGMQQTGAMGAAPPGGAAASFGGASQFGQPQPQQSAFPSSHLHPPIGSAGLFTPPPPGLQAGMPVAAGGMQFGMSQPHMAHAQSLGMASAQPNSHPRLVHPRSFPSMAALAAGLPAQGSNPNAEGQPPAPEP